MELYLTLAIAVGGIATGIGAILAAITARRQLNEQRGFLEEQTMLARREAQLTEESLAEQRRSIEEENVRARVALEVDLMYKLWERWTSRRYQDYRRSSLAYARDHFVRNGELQEVQYLDGATRELYGFYDELGYLTRAGVLHLERVAMTYAASIRLGWRLWEPAVRRLRRESDPNLFANFEYLYHQVLEFDRARGGTGTPPTNEELLDFLERQGRTEAEASLALPERKSPVGNDEG
jgi:hypothetical protein